MNFNQDQLRQALGALASLAGKPPSPAHNASTTAQVPPQPPQYPPEMFIVWLSEHVEHATRITTDGMTTIVYEVATSRASLGEWKWQEVPTQLSADALRALAIVVGMGLRASLVEAKLLQLKTGVVRIVDDPDTGVHARGAALDALRAVGMQLEERETPLVDESPLSE